MPDINIRLTGHAGRITLTRPKALNAMTYEMCLAIERALDDWRDDPAVALVVIDAEGDRAFCSGGDIAELYETGTKGDYAYGRRFWADEYRLNAKIFDYPKPVVSFLQGFVMGGGVGIGCHGSHRIVGETSQIAMPECGIGLVPDVGGSLMLALAPDMARPDRCVDADDPDRTDGCVFAHPVNRTSSNGVTGTPSLASPDKGEQLFAWMVEDLNALLQRGLNETPPLDQSYFNRA